MFEGSLVESRGLAVSGTQRWSAVGSVALQLAVAAVVVAIPLLRPGTLPRLTDAPRLLAPLAPRPPAPVVRVRPAEAASAAAMSVPAASAPAPVSTMRAAVISLGPVRSDDTPAPVVGTGLRMGPGSADGLISAIGSGPGSSVAVVRAKPSGPVRVSSGVSEGMLLTQIRPVYPRIAVAAQVEGEVVMEATISKLGRIESLHALSGPMMLRGAALDAVQAARYKPYQLNGEATEVQTTITVVFRLRS